jgi:valyl-tRNA synthetase
MGWPDDTVDLRTYYPTSLMITGFDILFFWASRMMMMGLELTGDVPFREVHIHGLVRDPLRQKMSKTKGNVVDPMDANEKFGTDAVRLSLMMAAAPGTDIVYTEERLTATRQFANKIWNAARGVLMNMQTAGIEPSLAEPGDAVELEDRWIFSRLHRTAESVNRALAQHRYNEVATELWQFSWHDFCDWYLEIKKLRFTPNSGLTNDWRNLLSVFGAFLRLQHPIMPFITEELWHRFGQTGSIALAAYPQAGATDESAEREMALMQEMITAARKLRADHGLDRKLVLPGVLYCRNGAKNLELGVIEKFANVKLDVRTEAAPKLSGAVRSTPDFDLMLELPEVDAEGQRVRLRKEIAQLEKLIAGIDRQLENEEFLSKAPVHVVDSLRAKRAEYVAQRDKSLAALNDLK